MRKKVPYERPSTEVVMLDMRAGICQSSNIQNMNVYMMVDDFGNTEDGNWDDEW